ncbi:MAG TPA: protein phosphatase 2C domain-containing protein [Syntrophobacteraceae bacterium]|nr:protein phosphatase 2C domain-containing protein [Syntrophobacteraceae bacterium]
MVVVESAGLTDVGRKRKANEDSLLVDDDLQLYIVADGVGGRNAGEVASRIVVQTIQDYMKRFKEGGTVEELEDVDHSLSKEANRLLAGVRLANWGVNQLAGSNEAYHGMGSTVAAVYIADGIFVAVNVGDSPIYLVHSRDIERISVLHTVLEEHKALDPRTQARLGERFRHMLTRAMGIAETVKPDICEIQCFKDDILVLSSDGLSDLVAPEEIRDTVLRERPEKACRSLVDLANERGGDDNITVVVVKVKETKQDNTGWLGRFFQAWKNLLSVFPKRTQ